MPISLRIGTGIDSLGSKTPYINTVLSLSPAIYHSLTDSSGTSAVDVIGGMNGVYTNTPALAQSVNPFVCPVFDGSTEFVNLGTVIAFRNWVGANFNRYSLSFWFLIDPIALGDASFRPILYVEAAGPAFLRINKTTTPNRFTAIHYTSGIGYTLTVNGLAAGWHHYALTSDFANTIIRHYLDGAEAANSNLVGNWSAVPGSSIVCYGANNNIPSNTIKGSLAHVAWWNRILTPTEVSSLART